MAQVAHQHVIPNTEHTQISSVASGDQRTLPTFDDFRPLDNTPYVQQNPRQKKARQHQPVPNVPLVQMKALALQVPMRFITPHATAISPQCLYARLIRGGQNPRPFLPHLPMDHQVTGVPMFLRQQHILIPLALAGLSNHVLQGGPMAFLGQTHQGTPLRAQDIIPAPGLQLAYQRDTAEFVVPHDHHSRVFRNPLPHTGQQGLLFDTATVALPLGQGPTSKGQTHNRHLRPTMYRHSIQNQSHFPHRGNSTRNQQPSYRFVPHLDPHGPIVQKTTQAPFNACAPNGPGQLPGYSAQTVEYSALWLLDF